MKAGRAGEELGASRSSTFRRLGWVGCRIAHPGIRQLNTRGDQRRDPEPEEQAARRSAHRVCGRAAVAQQGGGKGPAADRLRPSEDAHSLIRPFPVPAWGPGGRGPPVGPPRHGGCAPRLSGGRGRSHRHSSHAALGHGPPHRAHRGPPHRPSPAFSAALALALRAGHRTRSPQGHGPPTRTRPPVSLNTGP